MKANAIVDIAGEAMPLAVTFAPNARRYTLRLDPRTGGARLTLPARANLDDAIRFLKRHERWLGKERDRLAAPVAFEPGALIPLRGREHAIQHAGGEGHDVWVEAAGAADGSSLDEPAMPTLWISGEADLVGVRVQRWLKAEARRDLNERVQHHARKLKLKPKSVAVRDQRTRWGSCSSTGTLSFSWRLILAPPDVLDYVAAHEVAHLKEMNHSSRFWDLVRETLPEMDAPRAWLVQNGQTLHRYG